MESTQSSQLAEARSKLIRSILEAGKQAFDPSRDDAQRAPARNDFENLIASTGTWNLIPSLNALVKPGALPPWLQRELMTVLTLVPLRPDGVRGTLEFVFSVHPTNLPTAAEEAVPQKKGANITTEAVAMAAKLLTSIPSNVTPEVWFAAIGPQLFDLLDGNQGPELAKVAAQVIGYGVLGRKAFGAPGAPGWNVFVVPILRPLKPSIAQPGSSQDEEGDVIDLSRAHVLVSQGEIVMALKRLSALLNSNPNPSLSKRLLDPVFLELWALVSLHAPNEATTEGCCKPARILLETYLKITTSTAKASALARNLLYSGQRDGEVAWKLQTTSDGLAEIVNRRFHIGSSAHDGLNWSELQHKADTLIEILVSSCTPDEISSIFLDLFQRWLKTNSQTESTQILTSETHPASESDQQQALSEVTVLQKLMDKIPEKLISHFDQLLGLIAQVLDPKTESPLPEEAVSVTLSLLNLVITAPSFQKSQVDPSHLRSIEAALKRLGSADEQPDIAQTARNLSLLLRYRDDVDAPDPEADAISAPTARQVEDRKTYALALSYITSADSPPPVRVEGLSLLASLIASRSPVLDVPATLVLLSSLLKEDDDFLVLRAVDLFERLADRHPSTVLDELLEQYLDRRERQSTDARLRFGEAILRVVERLGQTFTGDVARHTCEVLLSIAGRRGRRPKTEARQARDEKARQLRENQARQAWDGLSPSELLKDDGPDEATTPENDVLAAILRGWESARGSEDLRIRASSLSLLTTALETNLPGVGGTLASSAVDLSLSVLALERGPESAIVRRAAAALIAAFVATLDAAREQRRALPLALAEQSRQDMLRTLRYVAHTDGDELARHHARDAAESLENWSLRSLLPPGAGNEAPPPGLGHLAGLRINPEAGPTLPEGRPKIEEVD